MESANIQPLWDWVLVKKEPDHEVTESGILLPNGIKVPNMKAWVRAIGNGMEEAPFEVGDQVLLHFGTDRQPVDIENDNSLLLVPAMAIIAVVGKLRHSRKQVVA